MKTLFPYQVLIGDVSAAVEKVTIDGKPLSTAFIIPDFLNVAFAGIETEQWDEAEIHVIVQGPELELASESFTDVTVSLQINCRHSNTTVAVPMEPDPQAPARWLASATLERDLWFGSADLSADILATVDGIAHRKIGSSEPWTLSFDDLPASPVNGSITVTWLDFSNDLEHPYLEQFKLAPFYLRLDPDDPSLFLNRGFEGLEALLVDRRRRPRAEQALHDSTRANIAGDAWSAMFISALDSVEVDPETQLAAFPVEPWRTVVLKTLLQRIYPDRAPLDALQDAVQARDSGEGSSDFIELLLPAAALQVGIPRLLRNGINLLERDAETKGD